MQSRYLHFGSNNAHTDDLRDLLQACNLICIQMAAQIDHRIRISPVSLVDHIIDVQARGAMAVIRF